MFSCINGITDLQMCNIHRVHVISHTFFHLFSTGPTTTQAPGRFMNKCNVTLIPFPQHIEFPF